MQIVGGVPAPGPDGSAAEPGHVECLVPRSAAPRLPLAARSHLRPHPRPSYGRPWHRPQDSRQGIIHKI